MEQKTGIKAVNSLRPTLHIELFKKYSLTIRWKFPLENTTWRRCHLNSGKRSWAPSAAVHFQRTPWQLELLLGALLEWSPLLWVHTYLSSDGEQARCIQLPFLAGPDGCQGREIGIPLPHLGKLLLLHLSHTQRNRFRFCSAARSKSYLQICKHEVEVTWAIPESILLLPVLF